MVLVLFISFVFADMAVPGPQKKTLPFPEGRRIDRNREVPEFSFSVAPTTLLTTYYDYMVGNYNSFPIRRVPGHAGDGHFLTFMAKRTPTGTRRVFWAYIEPTGTIGGVNEITNVVNSEGFPTMIIDPVSGKPMYFWHAYHTGSAGTNENDVQFTSDAFLSQIPGLINDVSLMLDNPYTTVSPTLNIETTDNVFIWPGAVVGPSPIANKRRVYVETRNSVTHTANPSGNIVVAYADFDGDDIELGNTLTWSYTRIPELDDWNVDPVQWRRPFNSLAVDQSGTLYYIGYHFAMEGETSLDEPDFDIFICDNYGAGTWSRETIYSSLPSWNPLDYFEDENAVPYEDDQMYWGVSNSGHMNAIVDLNGCVRIPALWALQNTGGTYWPAFQFVKEAVYNPQDESFTVREVYPVSENPDDYFQPWDLEAPWGEVDEVDDNGYPMMVTDWNFPYWDDTVHDNSMMFHYNSLKFSEVNDQQMMVAVWQNSFRARMFNSFQMTEYAAFADVPEIYIAVSPNNGMDWSEPISINKVETPGFTDIKPMWVFPADKVKYIGTVDGQKIGKLGLMFMNDFTWGSNVQAPPVHPTNDGGNVMFMELEITFPNFVSNEDPSQPPLAEAMLKQNYPNPFNPETNISFLIPKAGFANLSIYNVKGQLINTLVNNDLASGSHSIVWNGKDANGNDVASGMYFYRLTANGKTESRKMLLMK